MFYNQYHQNQVMGHTKFSEIEITSKGCPRSKVTMSFKMSHSYVFLYVFHTKPFAYLAQKLSYGLYTLMALKLTLKGHPRSNVMPSY